MFTHRALVVVGATVLAACGGTYPKGSTTTPHGTMAAGPTKPGAGAADGPDENALPPGGIINAALPYAILDARTGREVPEAQFWTALAGARAVCLGEEHPNPHHHWVQLHATQELISRYPKGAPLALGLEMIQRPFQGVVDDYVAKRIDADALQSRIGWEDRWGYNFELYHPTIDAVIAAGGTVLALNAARELTKKVSHHGLESLTPAEKAQLPELKLDDATHRAWWDAMMDSMGGGDAHGSPHGSTGAGTPDAPEMPSADRIYTVQVLWDESMADGTAKWLAAHPDGHALILAGTGHCHDSAVVGRIKRRNIPTVLSIRAVLDVDGNVAEALVTPQNDYLVVLKLPKP